MTGMYFLNSQKWLIIEFLNSFTATLPLLSYPILLEGDLEVE